MPQPLASGVHESIITEAIEESISAIELEGWWTDVAKVDPALLPDLLARYVHDIARRSIASMRGDDDAKLLAQVAVVNSLLAVLRESSPSGVVIELDDVADGPRILREARPPSPVPITRKPTRRPLISLRESALLVNGHRDYQIGSEVARELESADRVDLLSAFVRFAGLRLVRDQLARFVERGGQLRVITTVYTGSTEKKALDAIVSMGGQVKVSYETSQTRLHAKAWLFGRNSGFHTAYIGSSNLTHSALVEGLEWNVRVSEVDNPAILDRVGAAFEQYWNEPEFVSYDPKVDGIRLAEALASQRPGASGTGLESILALNLEFEPKAHQAQMLDALEAERRRGHRRNLVVAATGTGKTWVSAFDYRRLHAEGLKRLLFVAHRDEILRQSQQVFQLVMKDMAFGERFVASERPEVGRHVFASIQSLSRHVAEMDPLAWDVVIVDEFHHSEAATYRRLMERLKPSVLLGLTATPERADGKSILHYFDDRIACDLRLWQALDEGLLAPFHYFGINDGTDLRDLAFSRGQYGTAELEGIYTTSSGRIRRIIDSVYKECPDPASMRALGFCVGIDHAALMASEFNRAGLPAIALTGKSTPEERARGIAQLRRGEIRAIFTVDLFNEGVDIPEVDTVLLLRPTESATVFLQQLGRGLRHSPGKSVLTVLDFIGQAHHRYRFDIRFRALIGGTRKQLGSAIAEGFPLTPPGCAIRLDRIASSYVLENVRSGIRLGRQSLVDDLKALPPDTQLRTFLEESGHELDDVYANPSSGHSFTEIRRRAGFVPELAGGAPFERAAGRLLHVDDDERLSRWIDWLARYQPPAKLPLESRDGRLQLMLHAALGLRDRPVSERTAALSEMWAMPVRHEYLELLTVLLDRTRANTRPIAPLGVVPLHSHATYGLFEVVAALGLVNKDLLRATREGVIWAESATTDLLFVTLEKSETKYSATTRYQDYPISPVLFHWESQNATSSTSEVGRRYVEHQSRGSDVLLFVRNRKNDQRGETAPYVCLGSARYVRHESERPMRITWALERPMPPELFQESKVAAG
jgi:superfamily II DNA or RNA helicase/HKD family nuclease